MAKFITLSRERFKADEFWQSWAILNRSPSQQTSNKHQLVGFGPILCPNRLSKNAKTARMGGFNWLRGKDFFAHFRRVCLHSMLRKRSYSQSRPLKAPHSGPFTAAKRRRPRLPVLLNNKPNKKRPSGWTAFSYLVAGEGLEPTTSGLW